MHGYEWINDDSSYELSHIVPVIGNADIIVDVDYGY